MVGTGSVAIESGHSLPRWSETVTTVKGHSNGQHNQDTHGTLQDISTFFGTRQAMSRRDKASGKTKARRDKAANVSRRVASSTGPNVDPSAADLQEKLDRRTRELHEAQEQQAATSEVLRVISSSPGELQPVFDAMLENATRLCGAKFSSLMLVEGDQLRRVALHNAPSALVEHWRSMPLFRSHPKSAAGRAAATKQVAFDDDLRTTQRYRDGDPLVVAAVQHGGYRTVMSVPMLKDDVLVGIISIYRQEVLPFTDKQIDLVKNFAAQAVIAIENARLLNELRQRTDDLTEALEQQTATSEVLKVISSSPGDLTQVFETMLDKAIGICEAKFGIAFQWEGTAFRAVAFHRIPPAFYKQQRDAPLVEPVPGTALGRLVATKKAVQIADVRSEPAYQGDANRRSLVVDAGARTLLAVPMLKENELIGAISIYRQEVRPFTEKQIDLVKNFAAQAVIAIENTRLLNELRQRTDDLTESLEQQTATSEVLKVISGSPGELEPVFNAMLENAVRICEAGFGNLLLYDGTTFRAAVTHGGQPEWRELRRREPVLRPIPNDPLNRLVTTKQLLHFADIRTEQGYIERHPPMVALVDIAGARTVLLVPMLKDRRAGWRHRDLPHRGATLHRQADRAGAELRRPGCHRD